MSIFSFVVLLEEEEKMAEDLARRFSLDFLGGNSPEVVEYRVRYFEEDASMGFVSKEFSLGTSNNHNEALKIFENWKKEHVSKNYKKAELVRITTKVVAV